MMPWFECCGQPFRRPRRVPAATGWFRVLVISDTPTGVGDLDSFDDYIDDVQSEREGS